MDSIDAPQVVDPADPVPEVASEEEYYLEVRGLYLYSIHIKLRTTRYSPFELSEMPTWNIENIDIYTLLFPMVLN